MPYLEDLIIVYQYFDTLSEVLLLIKLKYIPVMDMNCLKVIFIKTLKFI